MAKQANKSKISLTIDPEVWSHCQSVGPVLRVNWSRVAEEAFVAVLSQLIKVQEIIATIPESDPQLRTKAVQKALKAYVLREHLLAAAEVDSLTLYPDADVDAA